MEYFTEKQFNEIKEEVTVTISEDKNTVSLRFDNDDDLFLEIDYFLLNGELREHYALNGLVNDLTEEQFTFMQNLIDKEVKKIQGQEHQDLIKSRKRRFSK